MEVMEKPEELADPVSLYENKLMKFVSERKTQFTIEDALTYLGLDLNRDSTFYAIQAVGNALRKLGCMSAVVFTPPTYNETKEDPLLSFRMNQINDIVRIIEHWVLDRREPFTIFDIYADEVVGKNLGAKPMNIRSIRSALNQIGCVVADEQTTVNQVPVLVKYNPPKVTVVDRDLIVT